MFNAQ